MMIKRSFLAATVVAVLGFVPAGVVQAAVIVKPTVAAFSTQLGDRQAGFTVTGTEFDAGENLAIDNGAPVPVVWPTAIQDHTHNWLTNGTTSGFITFELGATPITVGGLHMWNYNEGSQTNRGAQDVTVSFSSTSSSSGFGTPIPFTFSQSTGVGDDGESYLFASGETGRWARIDVLNNYGAGHVGLGEVRFFTFDAPVLPPVPEPSTFVLAAISLGGLSLLRRRAAEKRRVAVSHA